MKTIFNQYDIIVVGAGHAGCEAAHIAATLGSKVLLITMNLETIAKMSCNPAMGGVAKGQILREIDALGGMSAIVSDYSTIQFRMLNRSKGPAMWSPRSQNDRVMFSLKWRAILEQNEKTDFVQDSVKELIIEHNAITGVITEYKQTFYAPSVILTSGTFMNGLIHIGDYKQGGGRMGDNASFGITEQLLSHGLSSGRMKTGTPPRVDGRSLNYEKMTEQAGDENPEQFSYRVPRETTKQRSCHITYTNPEVHEILRNNFEKSPLFNGTIQSIGPRYCPSIEDKINRFAERDRHQIFVEPEGWTTAEVYVNGFSSSLPLETQYNALRKMSGFENVRIYRPGYAIEYDFFFPTQLKPSLETKAIEGLFFAGQINGTTGYEEAACQGLMAGYNAHSYVSNIEPLVLHRHQSYIGVLIDDLINKGTEEPYRMFTSRAEYRLLLRQDNADHRLMPIAYRRGALDPTHYEKLQSKQQNINSIINIVTSTKVALEEINPFLVEQNLTHIKEKTTLHKLLLRPELNIKSFLHINDINILLSDFKEEEIMQAEILLKYEHYLKREEELAQKLTKMDKLKIPFDIDYEQFQSISSEGRQKLKTIKPETIGQASRISGVSASDVSILLIQLGK